MPAATFLVALPPRGFYRKDSASAGNKFRQNHQSSQIYTDWANHYLERGRFKRFIQDLQTDVSDGVLLADVIEAVTGSKVPEIVRKPKGPSQMVDNISLCVAFLGDLGVSVDGIIAKDIKDGHLKAILSLFFNLSRYKQAQKASNNAHNNSSSSANGHAKPSTGGGGGGGGGDASSRLPSSLKHASNRSPAASSTPPPPPAGPPTPPSGKDSSSSIPAPSIATGGRKTNLPERTNNKSQPLSAAVAPPAGAATKSTTSPRSTSPHGSLSSSSFIPQPKSNAVVSREKLADRNNSRPSSTSSNSSIPQLPLKSTAGGIQRNCPPAQAHGKVATSANNVMLEKLKLANARDRCGPERIKGASASKRTSSSSGFSSARSERSDSSTSLCSEPPKTDSIPAPQSASAAKPAAVRGAAKKNPARSTAGGSTTRQGHAAASKMAASGGRQQQPKVDDDATAHYTTLQPDTPIRQSKISSLVKKSSPRQSATEDLHGDPSSMGVTSSIPKPTAAVKGTSKGTHEERRVPATDKDAQSVILAPASRDAGQGPHYGNQHHHHPQQHLSSSPSRPSLSLPRTDRQREGSQTSISIAMVTPIMSASAKERTRLERGSSAERIETESTSERRTSGEMAKMSPTRSVTSEVDGATASVDSKERSESITEAREVIAPESKAKVGAKDSEANNPQSKDQEELDDVMLSIKPMQPIMRASPYGYTRRLTPLSSGRMTVPGLRLQTEQGRSSQQRKQMEFARSYGCGGGGNKKASSLDQDYSSDAAGYMSDGDVLRPGLRSDDIPSGYLSEGGASLCSRRVAAAAAAAAKAKDPRTINVLQDDSCKESNTHLTVPKIGFDDSSSISSGISDTIAELSTDDNLTGSSVSSEANPYGSLPRDVRPVRRSTPVKKTDSSMQTESSAFQQMPSTAWKKYLQSSGGSSNSGEPRVTSDLRTQHDRVRADAGKEKKNGTASVGGSSSSSSSSSGKKGGGGVPAERHGDHRSRHKTKEEGEWRTRQGLGDSPAHSPVRKQGSRVPAAMATANGQTKRSADLIANGSRSVRLTGNGRKDSTEKLAEQVRGHDLSNHDLCDGSRIYSNIQVSSIPRVGGGLPVVPPLGGGGGGGGSNKSSLERKGKVKVCANTQTTVHDLYGSIPHSDGEYASLGSRHGSGANKYPVSSPSVRERMYGSPSSDYVFLSGLTRSTRLTPKTDCDNYVTLDHSSLASSNYAWFRPTPRTCSSGGGGGGGLTEAESLESLSSGGYSVHAQIQNARANSLTHARLVLHQREQSTSPRLPRSRSNSVRSTQSEKLYPSMLQRSDDLEGNDGPPSSPASQGPRFMFPLSPVNPIVPSISSHVVGRRSNSMSHYMGAILSKSSKEDDVHGSSLSLVSTSSSLYSSTEEKHAHEIRRLKKELEQANDKVSTLTSQLTTNAHMVAAFEQSLSNMTNRLQHLTASAEQKDSELHELRSTIEALKKQSAEAGLTKMALQSMQAVQRSTVSQDQRMSRQLSTDSMSSVNSLSSACSGTSASGKSGEVRECKKKKKKGWLRSSFSKAFSRSKKNKNGSVSDVEDHQLQSDSSTPNSPQLGASHHHHHHHHHNGIPTGQGLKTSHSSSAIYDQEDESAPEVVKELRKELREKDMVLTDIRLEALSSAHQLENLKETVNKMRAEMMNLKQDNERLQRIVHSKSLTSSQSSLPLRNSTESLEKRLSASEGSGHVSVDMYLNDSATDRDGKRVTISVFMGCHGDYARYACNKQNLCQLLIGSVSVSEKTKWDLLDNVIKRAFKEYVLRIDPVSNLGLNAESVLSYHIGDVIRSKEADAPELLPCGYLLGDSLHIQITLKGTKQNSVDALTFETLIPKSIIQRYVSLLSEHRRIILCGPSGTGKTYLAQKLSEFLVLRSGKELTAGAIATFSVDHKSAKELRQYLSNVAEQCESSASDLPTVIILDNLHHVGSLGEVFNGFLSSKYQKCPFIIGTMNQATCSTTNLQLHHNFRWVLCANHMEPVKGFLGRYLRRRLVEEEVRTGIRNNELSKIIDWIPKVWQHLNRFLETHSSSDVTIGPRLFLSCPLEIAGSQVWFTDLWNYSIVPYLLEAVREGLQLYGRRAPWEDPTDFVVQTYPWRFSMDEEELSQLLRLRQEDVGYEAFPGSGVSSKNPYTGQSDVESDPLLNMLMHLQEAASYSSPHSHDSDSISLDSRTSNLQPEDILASGLESTL